VAAGRGLLIIADIGGYTHFMRLHRPGRPAWPRPGTLVHAERLLAYRAIR
jgi:hypothetical protein